MGFELRWANHARSHRQRTYLLSRHFGGGQDDTITLKLDERRMGGHEYAIPDAQEPQSFQLPDKFFCRYKGKPADPSFIGQGAYLRITTREKGGVVLMTVLGKKN